MLYIFVFVFAENVFAMAPFCTDILTVTALNQLSQSRENYTLAEGKKPAYPLYPKGCEQFYKDPRLAEHDEKLKCLEGKDKKKCEMDLKKSKIDFQKNLISSALQLQYLRELEKSVVCTFEKNPLYSEPPSETDPKYQEYLRKNKGLNTIHFPVKATGASQENNQRCEKIWAYYNRLPSASGSTPSPENNAYCLPTIPESNAHTAVIQYSEAILKPLERYSSETNINLIAQIQSDIRRIRQAHPMLSTQFKTMVPSEIMNAILKEAPLSSETLGDISPEDYQRWVEKNDEKIYSSLNENKEFQAKLEAWFENAHREIAAVQETTCAGEKIENFLFMEPVFIRAKQAAFNLKGEAGESELNACYRSEFEAIEKSNKRSALIGGGLGLVSIGFFGAGFILGPAVISTGTVLAVNTTTTVAGLALTVPSAMDAYTDLSQTEHLLYAHDTIGVTGEDLSKSQTAAVIQGGAAALNIVGGIGATKHITAVASKIKGTTSLSKTPTVVASATKKLSTPSFTKATDYLPAGATKEEMTELLKNFNALTQPISKSPNPLFQTMIANIKAAPDSALRAHTLEILSDQIFEHGYIKGWVATDEITQNLKAALEKLKELNIDPQTLTRAQKAEYLKMDELLLKIEDEVKNKLKKFLENQTSLIGKAKQDPDYRSSALDGLKNSLESTPVGQSKNTLEAFTTRLEYFNYTELNEKTFSQIPIAFERFHDARVLDEYLPRFFSTLTRDVQKEVGKEVLPDWLLYQR